MNIFPWVCLLAYKSRLIQENTLHVLLLLENMRPYKGREKLRAVQPVQSVEYNVHRSPPTGKSPNDIPTVRQHPLSIKDKQDILSVLQCNIICNTKTLFSSMCQNYISCNSTTCTGNIFFMLSAVRCK